MLSGFPIGHEYWESAPYEMAFGLTHFRACNYNYEQVRYEEWIVKELANLGIGRKVTLPGGDFLRGQFGNDPDWENAFRNGPEYNEMFIEHEQPVRTATAFFRTRDGIDNLYVGIAHTEAHHSSGRGYFRMTLTGAEITASVDAPGGGTVVFDALLGVPVASRMNGKRLEFATWVPLSQSSMFAVAPGGSVRLFGEPQPTGIGPDELLTLASAHAKGGALRDVEVIDADRIKAYVRELRGKKVVIACGDTRFRAAGDELAGWLRNRYEADVRVTAEFPRLTCKPSYMDSFGWPQCGPDPVQADVLIGNCQDNGLMWKFVRHGNNSAWLPIEVNQNFPGTGRAVLMMSSPVLTAMNGTIAPERAAPQLVIGASFPSEAMLGVKTLQKMKP